MCTYVFVNLFYSDYPSAVYVNIVDSNDPTKFNMASYAKHFCLGKEDVPHPIYYQTIMWHQQNDESSIDTKKPSKDYSIKQFIGQIIKL